MAETDPFGRQKGEDPLAAMGWSAGETAAAETRATEVEAPSVPTARRRSNRGCATAVVTVGFLIAAFAVVVPNVLDAIDTVEEIDDAIPTLPSAPPAPSGRDGRAPQGLEARSMLRRDNLEPALRALRRATGAGRVGLIRIDAKSVLVTTLLSGNRRRLARATWDGEPTVLQTGPAGGVAGAAFAWSEVDAAAPGRIVRATTRGGSPRAFDYLVLLEGAGLRWSAFLKDGAAYSARPDGSGVSRVG